MQVAFLYKEFLIYERSAGNIYFYAYSLSGDKIQCEYKKVEKFYPPYSTLTCTESPLFDGPTAVMR